MADYWRNRLLETQRKWTDKDIDIINKIINSYYRTAMINIIKEFEAVYDKVLAQAEEGKQITPADLYKLDKYYQMQAQLQDTLQKLGDRTCEVLAKKFGQEYKHIYSELGVDTEGKKIKASKSDKAFATIDAQGAKHIANQIWAADGKSWSERVWKNLGDLQRTLNEGLIDCVITGKKTTQLKKQLMERFSVSYNRAETLVRTEMAHVETQAALDRYKSSGTEKVRIVVDPDERTCDVCAKWDDKTINIFEAQTGKNIPPFHPNCRCAIAPVVKDKKEEAVAKANEEIENKGYKPLEMGAIDKSKLDRMIEREKITDNEVIFWKYTNNNGKVVYSTKKEEDLPYGYEYYDNVGWQKTYHYYRDANVLARTYTVDEQNRRMLSSNSDKRPLRRKEDYEWYYHIENENTDGEWENRDIFQNPQNTLYAQCIDCGRIFKKSNPKSNAAKRCPECQAKYRKKYKAQKEKERRAKKKKTK